MTCSNTGYLSILSRSSSFDFTTAVEHNWVASAGIWHSFELQSHNGETFTLSKVSEPITLASLSFVPSSSAPDSQPAASHEVSIVSVGSSHILLCGFPSGNNDLVLLLWDLRYSVVLASQTHSIPGSLGRTKKNPVEVKLVVANASQPSQAILVLSPRPAPPHLVNGNSEHSTASHTDPNARSSVLVVPLTVPSTSKISNAMGRASASAKWIAQPSTSSESSSPHDGARAKLLRIMKTAMDQKRVDSADEAFFNWVKQEESRLPKTPEGAPKNEVQLGYQFVQDVLEIVFRQPKGVTEGIPYSPKIVRYVLERRAVSSGMVEGGLLPTLRLRKDWVRCLT